MRTVEWNGSRREAAETVGARGCVNEGVYGGGKTGSKGRGWGGGGGPATWGARTTGIGIELTRQKRMKSAPDFG